MSSVDLNNENETIDLNEEKENVDLPALLVCDGTITAFIQKLLDGKHLNLRLHSLDDIGKLNVSVDSEGTKILNPEFFQSKVYDHLKSIFNENSKSCDFTPSSNDQAQVVLDKTKYVPITLDALAISFLAKQLFSSDSVNNLMILSYLGFTSVPNMDILNFFDVEKETPEEVLKLKAGHIVPIIVGTLFLKRTPKTPSRYIFVKLSSSICSDFFYKNIERGGFMGSLQEKNFFFYCGEWYMRINIYSFLENFLTRYFYDYSKIWKSNGDSFI